MTIYRRGKKYSVSVYDQRTQRMQWVGTYATRDEATAAETSAEAGPTCDAYTSCWLVNHPRPSASTNDTYNRRVRLFAETFAGQPMRTLDDESVKHWALEQRPGVFEATRALINDAIKDGLHPGPNPLARLWPDRPRPAGAAISEADLARLADCAIEVWGAYGLEVFAPLIVTTAYQRLRLGDIRRLRRQDISPTSMIIRSEDACWKMRLTAEAAAAIASVPARNTTPLLFTSKRGSPLSDVRIAYYWHPVRAAFGVPSLKVDDLRFFRARCPAPEMQLLSARCGEHGTERACDRCGSTASDAPERFSG